MRVAAITGYEAVSAFGLGADTLWEAVLEGRSGIRPIERFDSSTLPIRLAADVPDIPGLLGSMPTSLLLPELESRCTRFTLWAAHHALKMSGLDFQAWSNPRRVGVFIADRETASGYIAETAGQQVASIRKETGQVDYSIFLEKVIENRLIDRYLGLDSERGSKAVQSRLGIEGPNVAVGTACASGNDSIGQAAQYVIDGDLDIALAGGCFELDLFGMIGFTRLEALTSNADPETACRPFDKDRSGFVMGSGAGVVVIEELSHALRRGAKVLGIVAGYGNCCDAYRATDPHPQAEGAYRALQLAMRRAQINASEIGYVAAHGTSTKLNDRSETIAIKRAFGEYAYTTPISASKSMIGHTIMAAGAMQAILALKTIETQIVHGTRNLRGKDPECDLDYVPGEARKLERPVDAVASNSFGFGGQNSCLVFKRYSGKSN